METYSRRIWSPKYIAVDALSRLDIVDTNNPIKPNMSSLAGHFSFEKEDVLYPANKPVIETAQSSKDYSIKHFHGADK